VADCEVVWRWLLYRLQDILDVWMWCGPPVMGRCWWPVVMISQLGSGRPGTTPVWG